MNRKNFLLKLFAMLGLGGSYIVDDESGGSGEDDDLDVNIDDDDLGDDKPDADGKPDESEKKEDDEKVKALESKVKELTDDLDKRNHKEQVVSIIAGIKEDYPDFDQGKVEDHLKELKEKDPDKYDMYNNEAGYRLIHETIFKEKEADNDEFIPSREEGAVSRKDELLEKYNKGETLSTEEQSEILNGML